MKRQHISLTEKEREEIGSILSKGILRARVAKRLVALQELDRCKTITEVSSTLRARKATVADWRDRYIQEGLKGVLSDRPKSGRPVKIDGQARAKVTALACSDPPEGYAKWSLRLLADKIVELGYAGGISHSHVKGILKKMS